MDNLYIFISLVVGLLFGIIGFLFLVYVNNKRSEDARSEANLIIENALKKETEILVEAKEKALNTLSIFFCKTSIFFCKTSISLILSFLCLSVNFPFSFSISLSSRFISFSLLVNQCFGIPLSSFS